ncbi:hypothetical protein MPTK1_2g07790 [Marchantia polymorpha subsp. ruderalis]|uniref:Uncharacterized protein n=1 Tax=Marchantia polymorpha TaxID=3197 RepID=A0A2R6XGM0_MARPO|nr:hypothetical protein MARPO_0015s0065 [Marchantia polymorpha]BBN01490.1 hypothetical protein Mp_2g07790 [Marchantia polymorpha subsp. ruderalis]|eukprot:PTQ45257.1 hypothetical protein MARPO_0015s0065 [Marchantia polymorpha]
MYGMTMAPFVNLYMGIGRSWGLSHWTAWRSKHNRGPRGRIQLHGMRGTQTPTLNMTPSPDTKSPHVPERRTPISFHRNARTQLASAVVGVAPQFPRRKAGRKERRKEVQDESTQYAYVNDDAVTARSGYRGVALRSDIRQAPRGYIWRPFPSLVAMLHVNRHVTGRELDDAKKQTHVAEPEHEHEPDRWKMARARGRPGLLDVSSPIHR